MKKDKTRALISDTIGDLGRILQRKSIWDLNLDSFRSSDDGETIPNPLGGVVFDTVTRRYTIVNKDDSCCGAKIDDAIAQAMVVYLLYRMDRGWGCLRSYQALSIWTGKPPARGYDDDDDDFPLENLWSEDIEEWVAFKKLGKTTLSHHDNFDNFRKLYAFDDVRSIWARSTSFQNQLHVLAEQAAVQMALHLSEEYAFLAAQIIHYALLPVEEPDADDDSLMVHLARSLSVSAKKESNNFPKTAYDDIRNYDGD